MKQHKKRIKKKKKSKTDEIVPTKHEKVGNINFYSEEVSKGIIEKLISLAISSNFTNKVEKKFNEFCYEELYQKINNFIQINHINHETDDFNDSDYILSKIKYQKTDTNEKRYKLNKHEKVLNQRNYCANSVLFDIANINKEEKKEMLIKNKKIDDYLNKSNTLINNLDLIKRDKIQYDISIKYNNFWGEISQPKSFNIDRTSTKFNILKNQKINSNKIIENENVTSSKNTVNINLKSVFLNKKSQIFKEKYKDNIEKKQKKFQPILEMPYIEISEEEGINKKKETEEIKQLRKEAIESAIAREEEKKRYNKNKKIKSPSQNNIKGKFCTDNEGRIVMIREIRPESLLKEFSPITSNHKEILPGKSFQTFLKENIIMEQKAKKNIIYNPGILNFNKNLDKDKVSDIQSMKRNNKNKINDNMNLLKEEILNMQPFPITYLSPRNERVEPSGSNFKIINPSIGVKIKEKNNIKVGGDNFFEKFHKYSINEFNKTLKETLEWETKLKLKGSLINNLNNNMNNIIKEEKDLDNDKTFRKTFSGGFKNRKNILKSNSDIFLINQKYPVLKEILLNDVEFPNKYIDKKMEKALSNENIFDRIKSSDGRINQNHKNYKYDLIDEFNKELIKGNFLNYRSKKPFLPKLPPKHKLLNLLNNVNFNKTTNNFYRTRKKRNNDIFSELPSPLSANNKKSKRIFSTNKNMIIIN